MTTRHPFRASLMLVLTLSSCTYWRVHEPGPAALIASRQPSRVKVTTPSSTTLILDGPIIRGDSLHGLLRGTPMSMPLSNVTEVAEERSNPVNIAVLAVGGAVLFTAILVSMRDLVEVPNLW